MSAEAVLERLAAIRIVPVITIDDSAKAADVAAALATRATANRAARANET